jgi:caffeoyl-CoA O-methyltransferase
MALTDGPWLDPEIAHYVEARCEPPDEVLADLVVETAATTGDRAGMQISPSQGALLGVLVRLTGASNAVELGTFTGYSSICIARALGPGGRLLCCDVSERWTAIARRAWERAGLDGRIELRLAPALETLQSLPFEPALDFAFIDADKGRYGAYYEELLPRLRPNGLMCVDNTLWSGRVVDESATDDETVTIREFNDRVAGDERVESCILPLADGMTLVRKR